MGRTEEGTEVREGGGGNRAAKRATSPSPFLRCHGKRRGKIRCCFPQNKQKSSGKSHHKKVAMQFDIAFPKQLKVQRRKIGFYCMELHLRGRREADDEFHDSQQRGKEEVVPFVRWGWMENRQKEKLWHYHRRRRRTQPPGGGEGGRHGHYPYIMGGGGQLQEQISLGGLLLLHSEGRPGHKF